MVHLVVVEPLWVQRGVNAASASWHPPPTSTYVLKTHPKRCLMNFDTNCQNFCGVNKHNLKNLHILSASLWTFHATKLTCSKNSLITPPSGNPFSWGRVRLGRWPRPLCWSFEASNYSGALHLGQAWEKNGLLWIWLGVKTGEPWLPAEKWTGLTTKEFNLI